MREILLGLGAAMLLPVRAYADEPPEKFNLSLVHTADTGAVVAGTDRKGIYHLDNIDAVADADLGALVGWRGATAHVYVLGNFGVRPNDRAGTIEGIDNIEVLESGVRLFEAWLEQKIAKGVTVRAGLYDLNSEFYATSASDLLIEPPFGVGSELAATGVNGPSIFPSSALSVRVRTRIGKTGYAQFAVLNAIARTFGDGGGVDTSFRDGVLVIGESGFGDRLRLAAGGWVYSKPADDLVATDAAGNPVRRTPRGAYGLLEWRLGADDGPRQPNFFLRGGWSDGQTGSFGASIQGGLLLTRPFASRAESAFSVGARYGWLSGGARAAVAQAGDHPARGEAAVEVTYSDRVVKHLTLQPDLQFVFDRGGVRNAPTVTIVQLRTTVDF